MKGWMGAVLTYICICLLVVSELVLLVELRSHGVGRHLINDSTDVTAPTGDWVSLAG
jgi:hypothetical protein